MIAVFFTYKKNSNNGFYPILDLGEFWNQVLFFAFCGATIIKGYFGNTTFIYEKI